MENINNIDTSQNLTFKQALQNINNNSIRCLLTGNMSDVVNNINRTFETEEIEPNEISSQFYNNRSWLLRYKGREVCKCYIFFKNAGEKDITDYFDDSHTQVILTKI